MESGTEFDRALAWKEERQGHLSSNNRGLNIKIITVVVILIAVMIAIWYVWSLFVNKDKQVLDDMKTKSNELPARSGEGKKYTSVNKDREADLSFTSPSKSDHHLVADHHSK